MLASVLKGIFPSEYLCWERQAESRSEYHAGQVFAMAGASRRHHRIVTHLSTALSVQLESRPCNNSSSAMRVRIGNAERYVYPDVVATCGREEFEDDQQDVLLNPLLIIEVLAPSTEVYDRGDKFRYYPDDLVPERICAGLAGPPVFRGLSSTTGWPLAG